MGMVYDEDMRCARIVRYNPVNRRRLADSSYYCGPAAPDQDDVARFSTLPKRLPTKPKCPKSRRKKRQRRKRKQKLDKCRTCGKKSAGDPHTGESCPDLFHTKRIQSR